MRPVVIVHTYRPRQVIFAKENQKVASWDSEPRSPNFCRLLRLMVVAVLGIGLGITHAVHCRVVELQFRVDTLKSRNAAIANENNRLEAADAQLCTKTAVVALLAKRKLRLMEPVEGQVQRVQTKI